MRRFLCFLVLFPVVFLSCKREEVQEDGPARFGKVQVNISNTVRSDEDGTRSLVTIVGVEKFVKAALFAFDSNGNICVRSDNGKNYTVSIISTEDVFEWELPLNEWIYIYVIENYGSLDLTSYMNNTSLTVSDLENLKFTCASSDALKALETNGSGLPMSGINYMKITDQSSPLDIRVGKLFARYNFRVDWTAFVSDGYDVDNVYVSSMRSNTEVPYFMPSEGHFSPGEASAWVPSGYKQNTDEKLTTIDKFTETDQQTLKNGETVTLYFLENCQGNLYPSGTTPATSWKTIMKDFEEAGKSDDIANCSYLEFVVEATKNGKQSSFVSRLYLGDDMANDKTSNFNVRRNVMQTLAISLSPTPPPNTSLFQFDHSKTYTAEAGEQIAIEFGYEGIEDTGTFDYDISTNDLSYVTRDLNLGSKTINGYTFKNSGKLYLNAASSFENESTMVRAGFGLNTDKPVSDEEQVATQETTVMYAISVEGTNYTNSTKNTITLYPYLVRYENDVVVSKTRLTSGVSWVSMPYDWEARRHANVSNSSGAAVVTYNYAFNNYESTPILNFPITCTYTYNGEVLTGSTVATFGETHFIKAWRMMKDSNHNWLTCPYVVLSEPCPELWSDRYEINVLVNYSPNLVTGDEGHNGHRTYQIQGGATTWPSAGNSTEGPSYIFPSNAQTDYQIGNFVFNQNGSPTEYYDSVDKIYYYLIAQGQEYHDVAQQNTIPSSYYVRIIPHSIWFDGKQKFTREYSLIIGTDYQEKYEIPHMSSSGRTSQVLVPTASGNNYEYRNIEDVIDYIEVKSSLGTVELHPSSSSVTHSDHFMYWGQSMYTYIYGPGDNCVVYSNTSSVMWNNVSTVELKWKYPYGRNYETRVSIITFDGLNYSTF